MNSAFAESPRFCSHPSLRSVTPSCGKSALRLRCHRWSVPPSFDRISYVVIGVMIDIEPPPDGESETRTSNASRMLIVLWYGGGAVFWKATRRFELSSIEIFPHSRFGPSCMSTSSLRIVFTGRRSSVSSSEPPADPLIPEIARS